MCFESVPINKCMVMGNWGSLQKGSYFISSWSGSSYTSNQNCFVKGGQNAFKDHERIYLTYTPKENSLKIWRKSGCMDEKNVWEYRIPPPP